MQTCYKKSKIEHVVTCDALRKVTLINVHTTLRLIHTHLNTYSCHVGLTNTHSNKIFTDQAHGTLNNTGGHHKDSVSDIVKSMIYMYLFTWDFIDQGLSTTENTGHNDKQLYA